LLTKLGFRLSRPSQHLTITKAHPEKVNLKARFRVVIPQIKPEVQASKLA